MVSFEKQKENLKILKEKTELSLQVCHEALKSSQYDVDSALLFLREKNILPTFSKQEIIEKCQTFTRAWANDFLETTSDSGELLEYYKNGSLETIRDNFYEANIMGIPETDFNILLKEELKFLTSGEKEQLESDIKSFYDKAVKTLLPKFISA